MEEYKKGEHASWDSNQEIETWKKKEAMLAAGEEVTDEEEDDEESAPAMGSLKQLEMGVDPERGEPDGGLRKSYPSLGRRLRALKTLPGISLYIFCVYDDCASLEVSFDISGVGPLFCMNMAV